MTVGLAIVVGLTLIIGVAWIALYTPPPSLEDRPGEMDASCVACGSSELERPTPGVYICRGCGFEGGENRGELERQDRQLSWSLKPWPERQTAALADLDDARMLLLGSEGELQVLAHYLEENDPLKTEIQAVWAKVALTTLDLLTRRGFEDRSRPGDILQHAYDELLEESDKAWGALRRAEEKVPELNAGPALPHQKLILDGGSGTGQSISVAMQVFREVSERYQRALRRLQELDAAQRS